MTTPTATDVAADFSRLMNVMNNDTAVADFAEAIASDHRTLVQKSVATMLSVICRIADDNTSGRYDDRNQAAVEICASIRDQLQQWDDERVFPLIVRDNIVRLPYI